MAKQSTTPKTENATPKTAKAPKVTRLSWAQIANQLVAELDGKTTLSQLAAKADAMFVEHGGKSRIHAAMHHVRRALETAEALGAVTLVRPTDLFVETSK